MNSSLDLIFDISAVVGLLALLALPAVLGALRDHRIDVQLREAERGGDKRRTGALVSFDLAYGTRENRVRRAGTHRPAARPC